jgi:hypothetical protein
VDDIELRLGPLDRRILLLEWRRTMGRAADDGPVQARRRRLLSPPEVLDRIRTYRSTSLPTLLDRRLAILERATLQCRIEQAPEIVARRSVLERRIAAFRPRWRGRSVGRAVVWRAVRTKVGRADRERAYRAEEPLYRPMEADLIQLAALRNDRARSLGFRSYPDYRLRLEGLSVPRLRALIEDALRYVPAEMRRLRDEFHERTGERGWYPWDVEFADHTELGLPESIFPGRTMVDEVLRAVRRWGFPSSAFRIRVDRHDLASGGMCLAPDPPRDVRIVVHPSGGLSSYRALFHEVGHALSSRSIRQPTHLLRWHEHLPGFAGLMEGEGRFFEQIATSEAWLRTRPALAPALRARAVERFRRFPLRAMAFLGSWVLPELELYEGRGRDLATVQKNTLRRVFGFDDFEPFSFADSFSVEIPVYSASYILAELLRPQLAAAVLDEVGGPVWPNPRIGPWLIRRWFRDGSSYDWWDRVREVTGTPFGARAFNEEMRVVAG